MPQMEHSAALSLLSVGPFSFVDTFGTRCTALWVGISKTVTAANCVTVDERFGPFDLHPALLVRAII